MRIHEIVGAAGLDMLGEAANTVFDDGISASDRQKCAKAVANAERLLAAKGFGFLLGPIQFRAGTIMGQHGYFDRKHNLPMVDATHYDLDGTVDAILHELGHKLYFSKGFMLRAKTFWKFFDPQTRQNVGRYGQTSHVEMFPELFRNFIRGRVDAAVDRWMNGLHESTVATGAEMLGEESALSRHRDYTWIRQDAKRWDATFQVGDHGYWFTAYESKGRIPPSYDLENVWVVQFGIDKEDAIKLYGHKHAIMNMTGLRKPFGVISTILAIFEDFINSKQPEIVWFSDSFGSSGRRKMYQMASDLLSKKYGYQEDQAVMRYFAKEIDGGSIWMLRRSAS